MDYNVTTQVRAVRPHYISGKPVSVGAIYTIAASQAQELIDNGKVELVDPETSVIVRLAARQEAARAARTGRGGVQVPAVF